MTTGYITGSTVLSRGKTKIPKVVVSASAALGPPEPYRYAGRLYHEVALKCPLEGTGAQFAKLVSARQHRPQATGPKHSHG